MEISELKFIVLCPAVNAHGECGWAWAGGEIGQQCGLNKSVGQPHEVLWSWPGP